MRIFGKQRTGHRLEAPLQELLSRPPADPDRIVGLNLMHDGRVTRVEERALIAYYDAEGGGGGRDLLNGLGQYFTHEVRTRAVPRFAQAALNDANILVGRANGYDEVDGAFPLGRILDVSGLVRVFRWAKEQSLPGFTGMPDAWDDDPVYWQWLDVQMDGGGTRAEPFLKRAFEAMRAYRLPPDPQPFQPSWVTAWDDLEVVVETEPPQRWLEVLGVARPVAPRWLIALRYPAAHAGTVARPTQVSAGYYAYHFPSPPPVPLSLGGHPADLDPVAGAGFGLVPEYIHEEIELNLDHFRAAGSRCAKMEDPTALDLSRQRLGHHAVLANSYGPVVLSWMDPCV